MFLFGSGLSSNVSSIAAAVVISSNVYLPPFVLGNGRVTVIRHALNAKAALHCAARRSALQSALPLRFAPRGSRDDDLARKKHLLSRERSNERTEGFRLLSSLSKKQAACRMDRRCARIMEDNGANFSFSPFSPTLIQFHSYPSFSHFLRVIS